MRLMASSSTCEEAPGARRVPRRHYGVEPAPLQGPAASSRAVGARGSSSVLAGRVGEQPLVDLAQGDGERLLLRGGVDQRADVLQQALGELAVVGVDLARALGGEDHQAVLAAGPLEQLVDRRVGDALGGRCDSGHGRACSSDRFSGGGVALTQGRATCYSWASLLRRDPGDGAVSNRTNSSAARATSSLTTTTSNSPAASSSACAIASRRSWTAGGSEPRPASRLTSSAQDGGARKTSWAPASRARTCRAPCNSISSSAGAPVARRSRTGTAGVP